MAAEAAIAGGPRGITSDFPAWASRDQIASRFAAVRPTLLGFLVVQK